MRIVAAGDATLAEHAGDIMSIDAGTLVRAMIGRIGFDPNRCWVQESNDQIVAWACRHGSHFLVAVTADGSERDVGEVLKPLLAPENATHTDDRPPTPPPWAGLPPLGWTAGVLEDDDFVRRATSPALWTDLDGDVTTKPPTLGNPTSDWSLATSTFRPPISRELMRLRREGAVRFEVEIIDDCDHSSAACHLERLVAVQSGRALSDLRFHRSEPALAVLPGDAALLSFGGRIELTDVDRFVVMAFVNEASANGIRRLIATAPPNPTVDQWLAGLGFTRQRTWRPILPPSID